MAEYKNEQLGVKLTIPDTVSIRKQLQYRRAIGNAWASELIVKEGEDNFYPLFFAGAKVVIEDWECERLPVLNGLNFDEVTNPRIADIVFWMCDIVAGHMNRLDEVPKNS